NRGHESLVVQQGIEQRHGRDVLKPPQEGYRCFYSFRVGLRLQEGMESFDPAAVNDLFDMFRLMEFGQTVLESHDITDAAVRNHDRTGHLSGKPDVDGRKNLSERIERSWIADFAEGLHNRFCEHLIVQDLQQVRHGPVITHGAQCGYCRELHPEVAFQKLDEREQRRTVPNFTQSFRCTMSYIQVLVAERHDQRFNSPSVSDIPEHY